MEVAIPSLLSVVLPALPPQQTSACTRPLSSHRYQTEEERKAGWGRWKLLLLRAGPESSVSLLKVVLAFYHMNPWPALFLCQLDCGCIRNPQYTNTHDKCKVSTRMKKQTNLDPFQPPSTASDVFTLGSLMVFLLTNGKTWIKSFEDAAILTSTTDHWLHKRYSEDLMSLLCQMESTKPEERPTAQEIEEETSKNNRKEKPELILAEDVDKFLNFQEQFVALLPKNSFQFRGSTTTFEQWTRELDERITDLRKQAGEGGDGGGRLSVKKMITGLASQATGSEGGVVDVGVSIRKLSELLMWLQDPMTSADLAQACSLLVNIEDLARIKKK